MSIRKRLTIYVEYDPVQAPGLMDHEIDKQFTDAADKLREGLGFRRAITEWGVTVEKIEPYVSRAEAAAAKKA